MKLSNKEQVGFWREHILKANQFPDGKQAYCVANNLPESTFYKWRLRIFGKKKKVTKFVCKKEKPVFLPVVVSAPELLNHSDPQKSNLPDPRWVAAVISNVIRGLI